MATSAQLQRFRQLLSQTLEPLLQQLQEQRNTIAQDMQEYKKLRDGVQELLRQEGRATVFQVPIGSGVSVQAEVSPEDARSVFVDTGVMGVVMEFPLAEAVEFVDAKLDLLQQRWDLLGDRIEQTTQHVELVRTGIRILASEDSGQSGKAGKAQAGKRHRP